MIVDVSHCGHQTTMDSIEVSKDPVIASHVGCRGVYDHPRNKKDEELQAISEKGGYVGIYNHDNFIKQGGGNAKSFLDQIDYAVDLLGVEHVGIGTDVSYSSTMPESLWCAINRLRSGPDWMMSWKGFRPEHLGDMVECRRGSTAWENWPYFTVGLVSRGYSDKEIQKIIGSNFLNIIKKIVG
jgi:membrane dipeptidase